ncbi:MAG: hypothetical protein JXA69_01590, partial [Phycisphaerae bacterium]|nr:hypothetical protein [Phycisphaerae bacterium]
HADERTPMHTSTAGGDAGRYGDVERLAPIADGHADGRTPMLALTAGETPAATLVSHDRE